MNAAANVITRSDRYHRIGERTRRRFLRSGAAAGSLWLVVCSGGSETDEDPNGDAGGDDSNAAPGDATDGPDEQERTTGPPVQGSTDTASAADEDPGSGTGTTDTPAPEVVFADRFADGTIGDEWTVVDGEFVEEMGYVRSNTPQFHDVLTRTGSRPYQAVEYSYRHGADRKHASSVAVAIENSTGDFAAYEDSWPRGDRDVLRVKHFPPFGEWRAALVYTPADYREAPLLGEALVTWGDPEEVNDTWHGYRIERGPDRLRVFVDGELVGTADPRLPTEARSGDTGVRFYSDTYRLRQWRQLRLY